MIKHSWGKEAKWGVKKWRDSDYGFLLNRTPMNVRYQTVQLCPVSLQFPSRPSFIRQQKLVQGTFRAAIHRVLALLWLGS